MERTRKQLCRSVRGHFVQPSCSKRSKDDTDQGIREEVENQHARHDISPNTVEDCENTSGSIIVELLHVSDDEKNSTNHECKETNFHNTMTAKRPAG